MKTQVKLQYISAFMMLIFGMVLRALAAAVFLFKPKKWLNLCVKTCENSLFFHTFAYYKSFRAVQIIDLSEDIMHGNFV